MDVDRKKLDPTLICTCSDLYISDIQEAINDGEEDYIEIMQYNYTLPRCGDCEYHVKQLISVNNEYLKTNQ
jgi:bacterioferritin-associated ferredoxin